jgi:hypothetical protein
MYGTTSHQVSDGLLSSMPPSEKIQGNRRTSRSSRLFMGMNIVVFGFVCFSMYTSMQRFDALTAKMDAYLYVSYRDAGMSYMSLRMA